MGWVSGIVIYIVIWWLLFFMVLPWGVKLEKKPLPGWAVEAPVRPYLGVKVGVTTLLSTFIWAAVYKVMVMQEACTAISLF